MARNRYDMDEVLEDSFDVGQLKRLGAYVSPYKKKMAVVIALMLSASAATMLVPIFFQRIMDIYIPDYSGNQLQLVVSVAQRDKAMSILNIESHVTIHGL